MCRKHRRHGTGGHGNGWPVGTGCRESGSGAAGEGLPTPGSYDGGIPFIPFIDGAAEQFFHGTSTGRALRTRLIGGQQNRMTTTNWSDDLAYEQAFLVSRGVRPLAIVGYTSSDDQEMDEARGRLIVAAYPVEGAIPFVLPTWENTAAAGYASEQWAIDLLAWAHSPDVPFRAHHLILGMLLGYSPRSVAAYDALEWAGNPTERGLGSSSHFPDILGKAQTSYRRERRTDGRADNSPDNPPK